MIIYLSELLDYVVIQFVNHLTYISRLIETGKVSLLMEKSKSSSYPQKT